ncbi:hypothetical protein BRADI_4g43465v3, partial [Brachypodium distachyon]
RNERSRGHRPIPPFSGPEHPHAVSLRRPPSATPPPTAVHAVPNSRWPHALAGDGSGDLPEARRGPRVRCCPNASPPPLTRAVQFLVRTNMAEIGTLHLVHAGVNLLLLLLLLLFRSPHKVPMPLFRLGIYLTSENYI